MERRDLRADVERQPSTLCTIAAALIGSAVVGAGASMVGASSASKAAGKAADANAAVQREQYQQTRADLQPYAQAGYPAVSALSSRFGLSAPAPANTNLFAAPQRPGPQIAAYTGPGAQQPQGGGIGPTGAADTNQLQPWMGGGGTGFAGIGAKAGASTIPPMPANTIAPANPSTANPSAAPAAALSGALSQTQLQQIMQDRPDVAAEYQKAQANGSAQQLGLNSQDAYVADWYNRVRPSAQDGYQLPASSGASAAPSAPAPGQTFTSSDNGGLGARQDPTRQTINRPDFGQAQPTYTDPTFGAAPSSASYVDPASFTTSPGYQFRLDQGLRADNANYAARGLLKSDAAVKGLNDYSQGMASSEYGNWFNQQMQRYSADANQFNTDRSTSLNQFNQDRTTGLAQYNQDRNVFNANYNTDTSRYDQNFNTDTANYNQNFNSDRGYNTDQYNTYTGNLFNLAGIGQSAAAGQANAGQNYAANVTANNNSRATVQGNAAIAGANGVSNAVGGAAGRYAAYSNPFSVGSSPYASSSDLAPLQGTF